MKKWLRRAWGTLGMGVAWAAGWALTGILIGVSSVLFPGLPWNAFFKIFDAPLPALAVPGFFGGVIFAIVLGVAGRRRRFEDLSLARFTVWGALAGVMLGLVPAAMVGIGLAHISDSAAGLWRLTAIISGPLALLSAASAAGSLTLARKAEKLGAGDIPRLESEPPSAHAPPPKRNRVILKP